MHWQKRLAALFIVFTLAGCAQGGTGLAGAQYAPYSPENNGNMHDCVFRSNVITDSGGR
jgi:hypothetical protein